MVFGLGKTKEKDEDYDSDEERFSQGLSERRSLPERRSESRTSRARSTETMRRLHPALHLVSILTSLRDHRDLILLRARSAEFSNRSDPQTDRIVCPLQLKTGFLWKKAGGKKDGDGEAHRFGFLVRPSGGPDP